MGGPVPRTQVGADLNGWWHPTGSGAFRLVDCSVTGGFAGASAVVAPTDPALTARVADAADRNSAKLVDLDPQWQMASCIWGLVIRLIGRDGAELLRGELESVPFRDIFLAARPPASTAAASRTPGQFSARCSGSTGGGAVLR